MKGWLALTLGLLAVVLGGLWTFQGLGYLDGSAMSGDEIWAVIGPITALAGLALIVVGMRRRSSR